MVMYTLNSRLTIDRRSLENGEPWRIRKHVCRYENFMTSLSQWNYSRVSESDDIIIIIILLHASPRFLCKLSRKVESSGTRNLRINFAAFRSFTSVHRAKHAAIICESGVYDRVVKLHRNLSKKIFKRKMKKVTGTVHDWWLKIFNVVTLERITYFDDRQKRQSSTNFLFA